MDWKDCLLKWNFASEDDMECVYVKVAENGNLMDIDAEEAPARYGQCCVSGDGH